MEPKLLHFSRHFGLLWNQKQMHFPGILVCCGSKTAVSSRDLGLQKQRLRQASMSYQAREARLQDRGRHACVIFYFTL